MISLTTEPKRLLQLKWLLNDFDKRKAKCVETVNDISLSVWYGTVYGDCGTTACAAGVAALSPVFIKQGLRFEIDSMRHGRPICYGVPQFKALYDYEAMSAFFGLSNRLAKMLFNPLAYAPEDRHGVAARKAVVKRIDAILKGELRAVIIDSYGH